MKSEIQQKLDEVPESILQEVLDYLRRFQAKTPEEQKRIIGLKRSLPRSVTCCFALRNDLA